VADTIERHASVHVYSFSNHINTSLIFYDDHCCFRIVVIAADISPIDVLSHLPILCEDKNVPYIYVKSRAEVGEACKTKRPTSCVLITLPDKSAKVKKSFDRCLELVKAKNKYVD